MKKVILLGATGATGKRLAKELVAKRHRVTAFVRRADSPSLEAVRGNSNFKQVEGTVLDMKDEDLEMEVKDADAIMVCLGHNLTFKGIFLPPLKLVTESLKRVVRAVDKSAAAVEDNKSKSKSKKVTKIVLMSSTGVRNKAEETDYYPLSERFLLGLIYFLLPPHSDNVAAAEYLKSRIGEDCPNHRFEWVAVRPGDLIENESTQYEVHPSPLGGVLFGDGQTSRFQVAHLMAQLIDDQTLWSKWKGRTPVPYDKPSK
jgi:nucleoside-diphosphate-sugar epimerase